MDRTFINCDDTETEENKFYQHKIILLINDINIIKISVSNKEVEFILMILMIMTKKIAKKFILMIIIILMILMIFMSRILFKKTECLKLFQKGTRKRS